jgi:hypothetical protein
MPKPNGTPGKKPPAPSGKVRPDDFRRRLQAVARAGARLAVLLHISVLIAAVRRAVLPAIDVIGKRHINAGEAK